MKVLQIAALCLILSASLSSRQQSALGDVLIMKVPERAIKLSGEDAQAFIKTNGFKHSQLVFEKRRKFYEVDGLISLFGIYL